MENYVTVTRATAAKGVTRLPESPRDAQTTEEKCRLGEFWVPN